MEWLNSIFDFFKAIKDFLTDLLNDGIPYFFSYIEDSILGLIIEGMDALVTALNSLITSLGLNDLIQSHYLDIPESVRMSADYIGVPIVLKIILSAYITKFFLSKLGIL